MNEIDTPGTKQIKFREGNFNARLCRGLDIAKKSDQIVKFTSTRYVVKSQKTSEEYDVLFTRIGWICSCRDHTFRGVVCKHIWAIWISQTYPPEQNELTHEKLFLEANFSW
jgi:hypothetical protein